MLPALKFVQRGVARRDLVPGLSHFRIKNGRCTGFNGAMALSAPVDIQLNIAPAAGAFIRALEACEDVISLRMDGPSKLIVRSGNFRTAVPCLPLEQLPEIEPEGTVVAPQQSILKAFEVLSPFIGIDASREWACGILLREDSAFVTNNIVLAQYWLGSHFPTPVNIPSNAVEEILNLHEELVSVQVANNSITFHYADGRWIRSQLISISWPNINDPLDQCWKGAAFKPIPAGMATALQKLVRFGDKKDNRCYFRGTDIATTKEGTLDGGALVEMPGLPEQGCFTTKYLADVLSVAQGIDFDQYPMPVPFYGENLRGGIVGIRS